MPSSQILEKRRDARTRRARSNYSGENEKKEDFLKKYFKKM